VSATDRAAADFELALYLVAAARDCLDEPHIYGPFRLIEGVSKLLASAGPDEFLARASETIDREKYNVMGGRDQFAAWLDELLRDFAAEARRRNVDPTAEGPRSGERDGSRGSAG
jgi:Family of unknown function (DUF6092)